MTMQEGASSLLNFPSLLVETISSHLQTRSKEEEVEEVEEEEEAKEEAKIELKGQNQTLPEISYVA